LVVAISLLFLFLDIRFFSFIVLGLIAGFANSVNKMSFRSIRVFRRAIVITVFAVVGLLTIAAVTYRVLEIKAGKLEPTDIEMSLTLVGFILLIAAYPMLRWFRREYPNAPRRNARLIFLEFIVSGLALMFLFSPVALAPRSVSCDYHGSVRYDGGNRSWIVKGQLIPHLVNERVSRPPIAWALAGDVDGNPVFESERRVSAVSVWYQAKTVNRISFPELFQSFESTSSYFYPSLTEKSHVSVVVPRYWLGRTYPPAIQTADMLDGNEELRVPVQFGFDSTRDVRLELINPVLRNFAGAAIVAGVAWSPFKWLVVAFFGIIGDQIKKRYLTSVVRKLFRKFQIVYGSPKTRPKRRQRLQHARIK
jgi:hypothetical protein